MQDLQPLRGAELYRGNYLNRESQKAHCPDADG